MALYRYLKAALLVTFTTLMLLSCSNITIDNSEVEFGERKYDNWTFMFYMEADNNLEGSLIRDIYEMYLGYQENVNIIILIDRHDGESDNKTLLGGNFTDTRLFRVTKSGMVRLSGGAYLPEITTTSTYEANMGDASNLKKFIEFSKANYPARKYALIIGSHGGGSRSSNFNSKTRHVVTDYDTGSSVVGPDSLFTAEITDVLGPEHSVDFFGLDACFMGNIEFAYQFRPGNGDFNTQVLVGSGPEEWGDGWKYDNIFRRVSGGGDSAEIESLTGGFEPRYSPNTMTEEQLARIVVEEYSDSTNTGYHSLGAYDLTKIESVTARVNELAPLLVGSSSAISNVVWTVNMEGKKEVKLMNYFKSMVEIEGNFDTRHPYFDLYELCNNITVENGFSAAAEAAALEVMASVDEMTLYSFGNSLYPGFKKGKNGMSIFLSEAGSFSGQTWYTPKVTGQTLDIINASYGKLAWCIDGATENDGKVSNWFELMDKLYDNTNSNGYTP